MKKVTLALFAIALVGILSAFTSNGSSSFNTKKFVAIEEANGMIFLADDPNQAGIQPREITGQQQGINYECLEGDVCTVTVADTAVPTFDPQTGRYYFASEDVLSQEDGEFSEL